MQISKYHIGVIIGLIIISCSEWDLERVGFTQIFTVGASEIKTNSAILLGSVEGLKNASVIKRGFVISTAANDVSDLQLNQPGVEDFLASEQDSSTASQAFIARASGLNGSTEYFFRAYIEIEGEGTINYGNIRSFSTIHISLKILKVERESNDCPSVVTAEVLIEGLSPEDESQIGIVISNRSENLNPTIDDLVIFSQGTPEASGRIIIEFMAECGRPYFIRGLVNQVSSEPIYSNLYSFSMIPGGQWIGLEDYIGKTRNGSPVSFSVDKRGYMAGGTSFLANNASDLWEYSEISNSWTFVTQVDSLNLSRNVVGKFEDDIYLTTGLTSLSHCNRTGKIHDDHETLYETVCRNCPGPQCPTCGHLGDLGIDFYQCYCYFGGMLAFDVRSGNIEYLRNGPLGRRIDGISFEINNTSYIVGGQTTSFDPDIFNCPNLQRTCISSTIQFHPETPILLDPFPGVLRFDMTGFTVGGKGYGGLGIECVDRLIEGEYGGERSIQLAERVTLNDFYVFDPQAPEGTQWKEVASFPETLESRKILAGFSIGQKGYVIIEIDSQTRVLWQFTPDEGTMGSWTALGPIPNIEDRAPYHLFTIGQKAYLYYPTASDNFWMYIPELE